MRETEALSTDTATPESPEDDLEGIRELEGSPHPPAHGYAAPLTPPPSLTQDPSPLAEAHAAAVARIEKKWGQAGQLSAGINGDVGDSILTAGKLAFGGWREDQQGETGATATPHQFVVAAPPGTGKTSHAIALMAASVSTSDSDPSKPFGCVFVVDQIIKADHMYRLISELLPGQVAVWTSDHDTNCVLPIKLKSPATRFSVDDLQHHAVVVVTQAFYRGPRGGKARSVLRGGQSAPRALTIFDEQTKEVEVFDIKLSQAQAVMEAGERDAQWAPILKLRMQPLLDFMWKKANEEGPPLETPTHDPYGWQVAQLEWFNTDTAERFVRSYGREIKNLEEVFGFAAQMANGCAFIFRYGRGENGTHFMGYVPVPPLERSSLLLDATSDIDGVTKLCDWRKHVPVPQVRYDDLHIVHDASYSQENLTDLFRSDSGRRRYAEHAKQLIKEIMPPGACGLAVCKMALVDNHLLPDWLPRDPRFGDPESFVTNYGWDLDGRRLAVTYWGGHGIGANDWKDARYVFLFGEHFLPKRVLIATVQGLQTTKATEGILASLSTANAKSSELELIERGHLLRQLKQMAMRGRARSFDRLCMCGKQVLVLTCDLQRLLVHADELFPGATLSKWGRTPEYFEGLSQPEKLMEILSDPRPPKESIPVDHIAEQLGAKNWRLISSNVMTDTVKKRVLENLGWAYVRQRGRGGGSRFEKQGKAILNPVQWENHSEHGTRSNRRPSLTSFSGLRELQ